MDHPHSTSVGALLHWHRSAVLLEYKRLATQRHRHRSVSMDARREVLAYQVDARHRDELGVEAAGGDDLRLARSRLPAEGPPAQLAAHDDVAVGEQLGAGVDGAEYAD